MDQWFTHQCTTFFPSMHKCKQTMAIVEYNKGERAKTTTSDEDEPSFTEGGVDGHGESVSYMGEDAAAAKCSNGGRKYAIMQKKGKWKSVSKVMAERGYYVSPQQCEDKFNDLNKRYKRLTDILGRGTSSVLQPPPRSEREDDEMLDTRKNQQDDVGDGDQDADKGRDHDDEPEENHDNGAMFGFQGGFAKRMK
ncbi:hypothetical protein IFM89_013726 [Coptis chinensis]|uniref:Myb/SANT-like DNA-binding domain-containing protein n=1 Tax=Coptis chinensis TaxID=261450 RepID=A0A835HSP6_9MAGN|nr:hypothetical protein IFM89_013726 [Coptis chinensis]